MTNGHSDLAAGAPLRLLEFWDQITEYEVNDAWRRHLSPEYRRYREQFEAAKRREYLAGFPVNIEIEASYYCNLRCPFCPRFVGEGQRELGHMSYELWRKILDESRAHGLPSLMMDHEAESMMNPRLFPMLEEARDAGILDRWLSTNGVLLTPEHGLAALNKGMLQRVRLECEALYVDNGAINAMWRDVVEPTSFFGRNIGHVRMPMAESFHIRSEFTVWLVERILAARNERGEGAQ